MRIQQNCTGDGFQVEPCPQPPFLDEWQIPKCARDDSNVENRYTYSDVEVRSKALANALAELGIKRSDRVGTIAWNGSVSVLKLT